jgi:hypothetical protein
VGAAAQNGCARRCSSEFLKQQAFNKNVPQHVDKGTSNKTTQEIDWQEKYYKQITIHFSKLRDSSQLATRNKLQQTTVQETKLGNTRAGNNKIITGGKGMFEPWKGRSWKGKDRGGFCEYGGNGRTQSVVHRGYPCKQHLKTKRQSG